MICHLVARMKGYGARQRSPHMDWWNLRGLQGAVKHGKRSSAAFDEGCIIIATRAGSGSFTILLQLNFISQHDSAAFVHHLARRVSENLVPCSPCGTSPSLDAYFQQKA